MDRRSTILDGALAVLAEQGMRGLTHRAVDAAAGLPSGSTSYYFRSRAALVAGCVQRLLEWDLAEDVPDVEAALLTAGPDVPGALAAVLTAVGVRMATTERWRTLVRYELSLAAVRDPALRDDLIAGGDTIRRRGAALLAMVGAVEPETASAQLAAVLDGLVYTALVRGPHDPEALAAWLRPALEQVVHGVPGLAAGSSAEA
ncbi:TetR/AcrR family transcriptional regulator [Pseudonocardia charpentierae]|uniref:TetR family transcriptional regulator n=1 Tax=Pseudonocardia charpentierae TaxID=3075545 RepID=A0ABU2NCB6_9PSEU|nr:TetR family transcriptional regulator [Pseudonocardia sp. DSM 45834]MDT0351370.1 TetR family transcriptional regulator [Pseudonocardia sp. DSM 45834]